MNSRRSTAVGFLFKKTHGHLLVIRGFTSTGDVISNDPAVFANADARKVYAPADFEEVSLPPNVADLPPNW